MPENLWTYDAEFLELSQAIKGRTVVNVERQFYLYQLAKHCAVNAPGCAAEVGVYKGGTAYMLSAIYKHYPVFLFDTFEGMPECDPAKDLHRKGNFGDTSYESVVEFMAPRPNAFLSKGFFPESASRATLFQFSFVHVDCDIWQSVKDCIEFFYPRMLRGGMMLFDDYGARSCPGAKLAVNQSGLPPFVQLQTGQALVIK